VFAGTSSGYLYHLGNLSVGFGTILTVLGCLGLGRALWKRHPWAIALVLFALAYYVLIGKAEVKFLRYTFPLIPVLAVGAGWLVGRAHTHPKRQWKAVGAVALLGLGGFWGGGAATAVQATTVMAAPRLDPRSTTAAYFRSEAKGATIGLVTDPWFYTPDFYPDAGVPRAQPFEVRNVVMKRATRMRLLRFVPEDPDTRQDWDVRMFTLNPDFVVFSSFETEGIDRLSQMQRVPSEFTAQVGEYKAFMSELQEKYTLVQSDVWNPWRAVHDLMYIRPTIWVWKSKTYIPKPSTGSSTNSPNLEPPAATR
jgi:hypothetical protein